MQNTLPQALTTQARRQTTDGACDVARIRRSDFLHTRTVREFFGHPLAIFYPMLE